jgi:hypothetical protein
MTMTEQCPSEWHRLARVSSVVDIVARHVHDLIQIVPDDVPQWLAGLAVPAGWCIARFDGDGAAPSRIAVCGPQSDGGWDGCETSSVFGFTGIPDIDMVRDHADCALRDLHAEAITTHTLVTPQLPGTTAVRSSGCFATAGLWIWAQYSTYVAGSTRANQGRVVQHSVFVESGCQAKLSGNVTQLSDAIYQAFLADISTRSSQIDRS